MLICVPTNGNAGLEDTVCDHFGSAPYFTLYDTTTEKVTLLENRNAHHSHGTCHPMNQLAKHHVDCIVCSGMGRRAIEALNSEGVRIYQAEGGQVGEAVRKMKANSLVEIDPARACRGQGQKAGFAHGPFGPDDTMGGPGRGAGFGQGGDRGQGGGRGRGQGRGQGR